MKRLLWFIPVVCAVLVNVPSIVQAASINIDDSDLANTITITAGDFERGFFVNDLPLQAPGDPPQSITLREEDGEIRFRGEWADNGALTAAVSRTIYLVTSQEPTLVSDILQYSIIRRNDFFARINGSFLSDSQGNLGALPPDVELGDIFVENGTPLRIEAPSLTLTLRPDIQTAVPEPGTLVLLGGSLIGLALWARKRHAAS